MGGTRVNASSGSAGLSFHFPENRLNKDLSGSSEIAPLACQKSFDSKNLICSSSSGPMSWMDLFSERPPSLAQQIRKNYFAREEQLENHPEFLNYFQPHRSYPLTTENLILLTQSQPALNPYFQHFLGDPSCQFSIQTVGTMKTPEGFELPLTELTLFRKAEKGEELLTSGGKGTGEPNPPEPPTPKIRGVQMSLLFVGGTILSIAAMDHWGVPERLQGPLMIGAFLGAPTVAQFGLSRLGMAQPVTWRGFGANVSVLATSWSYFAPFQVGASFLLDKTGVAEFGTKGNTYGSVLLGSSPFVAAKFFPKLRPFVGLGEASTISTLAGETTLAVRGLNIVSKGFQRFIPVAGGILMADTFAGWGVDLGEWITGQDKDNSQKLHKFAMDLLMGQDFGQTSMSLVGRWMGLWAEVGLTARKLHDHFSDQEGPNEVEKLCSQFIGDSNRWGQSMREVLIQLAFQNMKDGKLDSAALQNSIQELYRGPHSVDIKNAYFLLSKTGYAASHAQRIKEMIHPDGSFTVSEMDRYLNEAIGEELKTNFQKFMEERLIQFTVQSFRTGPAGNSIDWATFEKKVMDLYDSRPDAFKEIYLSQKGASGRELRGMISKEGAIQDIPAVEKYLTEILKNRK